MHKEAADFRRDYEERSALFMERENEVDAFKKSARSTQRFINKENGGDSDVESDENKV